MRQVGIEITEEMIEAAASIISDLFDVGHETGRAAAVNILSVVNSWILEL